MTTTTAPARRNLSHAACTHANTTAARRVCRAGARAIMAPVVKVNVPLDDFIN